MLYYYYVDRYIIDRTRKSGGIISHLDELPYSKNGTPEPK